MSVAIKKERLNIYLPKRLAGELRELVPDRERTAFFIEILERELRRKRLAAAVQAANGAWRDEDHPELATPEAIDRWIADNRANQTRQFGEGQI